MARDVDELRQRANLVDGDPDRRLLALCRLLGALLAVVLGVDRRLDLPIVRMRARFEPRAGAAAPARDVARSRLFAQQPLRERACESELADAARPMHQQRVR